MFLVFFPPFLTDQQSNMCKEHRIVRRHTQTVMMEVC